MLAVRLRGEECVQTQTPARLGVIRGVDLRSHWWGGGGARKRISQKGSLSTQHSALRQQAGSARSQEETQQPQAIPPEGPESDSKDKDALVLMGRT